MNNSKEKFICNCCFYGVCSVLSELIPVFFNTPYYSFHAASIVPLILASALIATFVLPFYWFVCSFGRFSIFILL